MKRLLLAALGATLLIGCGAGDESDSGSGSLVLRVSGEGAAKEGYPFQSNDREVSFEDGWTLDFDHYVVSLADIRVASSDGDTGHESAQSYLADLTRGDPTVVELGGLAARRWDQLSFRVVPARADAVRLNAVDEAVAQRMVDRGLNYWVEGSASKDGLMVRFELGLVNPTTNRNCTNGLDNTSGVVVPANSTAEAELTVHAEHMFWDTLGSRQLLLRFDPFAATADSDGLVTMETLAQQRLSDIRGLDGEPLTDAEGNPIIYNPGSVPLPDNNLAEFVLASTATQVHLNGLGLCTVVRE